MHASVRVNSILPTFTGFIGMENYLSRILFDSGYQSTFILDSVSEKLNLPIMDSKFNVEVSGFNSTQGMCTKVVNLDLALNSDYSDVLSVPAICVPKIDTTLSVPDLDKLVNAFNSKNIPLADTKLTSSCSVIDEIDIILGANAIAQLDCHFLRFGRNNPSCSYGYSALRGCTENSA